MPETEDELNSFAGHAIFAAIRAKNLDEVRRLVAETPALLTQDAGGGWTPVHEAMRVGHDPINRFIRDTLREQEQQKLGLQKPQSEEKAPKQYKDTRHPVEIALQTKDFDKVTAALDETRGKKSLPNTILYSAAQTGDIAIFKLLAEQRGVSINQKTQGRIFFLSPLSYAIEHHHNDIVDFMVDNPNCLISMASPPYLVTAIHKGNKHAVEKLLARKDCDPNIVSTDTRDYSRSETNSTALAEAIDQDNRAVLALLLSDSRITVNTQDREGDTALHNAVSQGNVYAVKELLARPELDPNLANKWGLTPLMTAVGENKPEVTELLLADPRVDVNCRTTKEVNTALHLALQGDYLANAVALLNHPKLDISLKNAAGQNAAFFATLHKPNRDSWHEKEKKPDLNFLGVGKNISMTRLSMGIHVGLWPDMDKLPNNYSIIKYAALQCCSCNPTSEFETRDMFGQLLAKLIKSGAIKAGEIPSDKNNTPEGLQRFAEFAHVISTCHGIAAQSLQLHGKDPTPEDINIVASNLIEGADHNWGKTSRELAALLAYWHGNTRDTVHDFIQYGILPELVRVAGGGNDVSQIDTKHMTDELHASVVKVLTHGRGPLEWLGVDERWHARSAGMLHQMWEWNVPTKNDQWYGILPGKEIKVPDKVCSSGIRIVNLTNEAELREEGGRLEHCVGGYAAHCTGSKYNWHGAGGVSHIFSLRTGTGEGERSLSTVEAYINHQGKMGVNQHQGLRNTTPPEEEQAALAWFVKEVNEGRLKLDTEKMGRIGTQAEKEIPDVISEMGIIPDSAQKTNERFNHFKRPELRPVIRDENGKPVKDEEESTKRNVEVYKQERRTYLLPHKYHEMNVSQFLETTGLGQAGLALLQQQSVVSSTEYPEPLTGQDTHALRMMVERYQQEIRHHSHQEVAGRA